MHAPHRDGYSSSRNQGWLYSGALYAVFRAPGVTRECIAGSRTVLDFAERHDPSLIADAEFCYVLGSPHQADAAVDACREAGIDARPRGSHPQLRGSAAANGYQADTAFEVTQTTVLGIPGLILPTVVCIGGGPHLIPQRTAEACEATLCIPFDNQPARPESVHRPP